MQGTRLGMSSHPLITDTVDSWDKINFVVLKWKKKEILLLARKENRHWERNWKFQHISNKVPEGHNKVIGKEVFWNWKKKTWNFSMKKHNVSITTNKNTFIHRHIVGKLWAIKYENKYLNSYQREKTECLPKMTIEKSTLQEKWTSQDNKMGKL